MARSLYHRRMSQGSSPARRSRAARAQRSGPWRFAARWRWRVALAACGAGLLLAAYAGYSPAPMRTARVLASYPHDPAAFTQGLVFDRGELFESTGLYGRSTLRRVDLTSGAVLQQTALPRELFGEGITVWRDQIVQLTWRAGVGLRYDRDTFERIGQFPLAGEGWGITDDGRHWITSDGTDRLRFLDPSTGGELRSVRVHDGLRSIRALNELEYVRGEIWANVWHEDYLVRIDPRNGAVLGYLDLSGLWPRESRAAREAVLNGIAYDAAGARLLVTGKYWPRLYQIELPPGTDQGR